MLNVLRVWLLLALLLTAGALPVAVAEAPLRVGLSAASSGGIDLGWRNVTASAGPPPLAGHWMVYDEATDEFFLFGGQSAYQTLGQLWSLSASSYRWSLVTPAGAAPTGRADPVFVRAGPTSSRPDQDLIFLFGGWYNDTHAKVGRLADTWFFFPGNQSWRQIATVSSPAPISDSAAAFDPWDNLILIYGGYNGTYGSGLWAFNLDNSSWSRLAPRSSANPPPLADARMQYDPVDKAFIMFGGNNGLSPGQGFNHYDTTWEFNMSTLEWTLLHPAASPSPRDYAYFAYDKTDNIFLLFGGYGDRAALSDTWTYSLPTDIWTRLEVTAAPTPRIAGGIAFSSATSAFVIYGGGFNDSTFGDTWALSYPPPASGPASPTSLLVYQVAVAVFAGVLMLEVAILLRSRARRAPGT